MKNFILKDKNSNEKIKAANNMVKEDMKMRKGFIKVITGILAGSAIFMSLGGSMTTAQAAQTGWVYDAKTRTHKYFDKNGKAYTGWHWMTAKEGEKTAHWSYFGNDGILRTGWQQMGKGTKNPDKDAKKHWSYFGANGWLRTGWVRLGKSTSEPDGNSRPHWSYFGENGWLREGWQQMGKGTGNPDKNNAKHFSYFGSNGWLRTGWVEFGKGTGEPDGNKARHHSYFGDNGWLRTGLQDMGKGTGNPDGNNPKHKSYFDDYGWLAVNKKVTVAGATYNADSRGWLTVVAGNSKTVQKFTVTFTDGNGKILSTQTVEKGKSAKAPSEPKRNGYIFAGWDNSFNSVTYNITVNATWDMTLEQRRKMVLDSTNDERRKVGVGPVTLDPILSDLAQKKAELVYEAVQKDGTLLSKHHSIKVDGDQWMWESMAITPGNPVSVWMTSTDGHREALLGKGWKYMGIGYCKGVYVQQFLDEPAEDFPGYRYEKCPSCGNNVKNHTKYKLYIVNFKFNKNESEDIMIKAHYCEKTKKFNYICKNEKEKYDKLFKKMGNNYKTDKEIFENIKWYQKPYARIEEDGSLTYFNKDLYETPKVKTLEGLINMKLF